MSLPELKVCLESIYHLLTTKGSKVEGSSSCGQVLFEGASQDSGCGGFLLFGHVHA
jgi:hypothetical protein